MTDDDVLTVVRRNLIEILPELTPEQIVPGASMRELGASSLDRVDVVLASQYDLGITVPASALAEVTDIGALVTVLRGYL